MEWNAILSLSVKLLECGKARDFVRFFPHAPRPNQSPTVGIEREARNRERNSDCTMNKIRES